MTIPSLPKKMAGVFFFFFFFFFLHKAVLTYKTCSHHSHYYSSVNFFFFFFKTVRQSVLVPQVQTLDHPGFFHSIFFFLVPRQTFTLRLLYLALRHLLFPTKSWALKVSVEKKPVSLCEIEAESILHPDAVTTRQRNSCKPR